MCAAEGLGSPGQEPPYGSRPTEGSSSFCCSFHTDFRRLELTLSTVEAAVAAKELRRWVAWLGGALVGSCVFTALALAGLGAWLIAPAIVIGRVSVGSRSSGSRPHD